MKILKSGYRWGSLTWHSIHVNNFGEIKMTAWVQGKPKTCVLKAMYDEDTKRHFLGQLYK